MTPEDDEPVAEAAAHDSEPDGNAPQADEPPKDGEPKADEPPKDGEPKDGEPKADEPSKSDGTSKASVRWYRRRWLKVTAIVLAVLLLLSGGTALLVRWSIGEHERLMTTAVVSQGGVTKMPLFTTALFDDFGMFRVPAIVHTKSGDLLVFAEGRASKSDYDDIALVMRRSSDNGATWSDLEVVLQGAKGAGFGNPAPLFDDETGKLWLFYRRTRLKGKSLKGIETYAITSEDDGKTWTKPRNLKSAANKRKELKRERFLSPSPGHALQLGIGKHKGRLLLASFVGRDTSHSVKKGVKGESYVLYSDDHGKTWSYSAPIDYGGEAHIVELGNGDLMMVIRTRALRQSNKRKRVTWSRDGGATWEKTVESDTLREPVCQGTLLRLQGRGIDGNDAILYMQPSGVAKGRWDKSARKNLTVWMSSDDGKTWPIAKLLHRGGASYSDMVLGDDGRIHVTFEVGTKKSPWSGSVSYANFAPSWLDKRAGPRDYDEPFSEWVYDTYQEARAPIEEWLKGD